MSLNARIDLQSLKSLPRGVSVSVAFLLLSAAAYFFGVGYLDTVHAKVVRDNSAIRQNIASVTRQVEELENEIASFTRVADTYREAAARGFLDAPDRMAVIRNLNALRTKHRLHEIRYNFQPERTERVESPGGAVGELVVGHLDLTYTAFLDRHAVAFWEDAVMALPGRARITDISLKRSATPDDTILKQIEQGKLPALVTGTVAIQWNTIRFTVPPAKQEGPR